MKRRRPNGFTLLELLLAVSILSLITAAIMGGIHLGRRSWETSRASEALDDVDAATRAITTLLGKSFPVSVDTAARSLQGSPQLFLGASDDCRFVALSDGGAQWGGLIVTEIGVDNGPEGRSLAVWTKPYRPQQGLSTNRDVMKKTILVDGLESIQFSYYGVEEQEQAQTPARAATWSEKWSSVSNTPSLVSVKIILRRLGRDIEATATVAMRQQ